MVGDLVYGANRNTGEGATLLLEPVGTELYDRGLEVRLRGSPEPSVGLATLRVVDENGDAVRRGC